MRREYVECDLCGKEVILHDGRLQVVICEGVNKFVDPKAGQFKWRAIDICPLCARTMQNYIKERDNK